MPHALSSRLAAALAAEHLGPLSLLAKTRAATVDQLLLGRHGPRPGGAGAGEVWEAMGEAFGVLPGCPGTLKQVRGGKRVLCRGRFLQHRSARQFVHCGM